MGQQVQMAPHRITVYFNKRTASTQQTYKFQTSIWLALCLQI